MTRWQDNKTTEWQKLQKVVKDSKVYKSWQTLPNFAKNCQKLPNFAKRYQKWTKTRIWQQVVKCCQKLSKRAKSPKVGKRCQTLLEVVESCHNLPTGIKNGQKRQIWQQVVKCYQKFPTVGKVIKSCQNLTKKGKLDMMT